MNMAKFLRTPFLQTSPVVASEYVSFLSKTNSKILEDSNICYNISSKL